MIRGMNNEKGGVVEVTIVDRGLIYSNFLPVRQFNGGVFLLNPL